MKKLSFYYVLALAIGLIVYSCSKDKDDTPPTTADVPTISSFSPTSAAVGEEVTITGTNFATTTSGNTVQFNGVNASLNSATATQLVAVVPSGATTGKITVKVGSNTATSSTDFEVLTEPIAVQLNQTTLDLFTFDEATLEVKNIEAFEDADVSWNSQDTDVVTVDENGNLTAVGVGTTNIVVAIGELAANCAVTVEPNVYACGGVRNGNKTNFMVWKNGEQLHTTNLPEGASEAYTIYVREGDVYYAGEQFQLGFNRYAAAVWNNGEELYILNEGNGDAQVNDLVVTDAGDVIAVGSEINENTDVRIAKVWVNGEVEQVLNSGEGTMDADAFSVAVSENDEILVAGVEYDAEDRAIAKVWKDGQVIHTLNELDYSAFAKSIAIKDGQVLVAGYEEDYINERNIPKVWVDGVATTLAEEGQAFSIDVEGNDVYIAGKIAENSQGVTIVWKNNAKYEGLTGGGSVYLNAIDVFGMDVYVAGWEWKNELYIPQVRYLDELLNITTIDLPWNDDAQAFDVFVE